MTQATRGNRESDSKLLASGINGVDKRIRVLASDAIYKLPMRSFAAQHLQSVERQVSSSSQRHDVLRYSVAAFEQDNQHQIGQSHRIDAASENKEVTTLCNLETLKT